MTRDGREWPAALTGIAQAEGFDEVFAAQLCLLAAPEDMALGLSVDGRCANVAADLVEITALAAGRRSSPSPCHPVCQASGPMRSGRDRAG